MSFLSTSTSIPRETPVPDDVSTERLVERLRDRGFVIKINPFIETYEKCEPSAEMSAEWKAHAPNPDGPSTTYICRERVPHWGLVEFQASFQDIDNGYFSLIHAALGTKLRDRCEVITAPSGARTLKEVMDVTGNIFFFAFIKSSIKKAHGERHVKMLNGLGAGEVSD